MEYCFPFGGRKVIRFIWSSCAKDTFHFHQPSDRIASRLKTTFPDG
jgi:hypothetical protein